MKRLLVVDDESPVVEHIVRTVEKELAGEFVVVGTASSGREALEKVPATQPEIIVMDVRMPGLSGLDTIRELKRRGSSAVFLLSTAYERFDIAREALELGITSYLLKPVLKEVLVQALRDAADQFERVKEAELKAYDFRERDRRIRNLVIETFLGGLMLGWNTDEACRAFGEWLGIQKSWGLVAAAAFEHHPQEGRDALESLLQYKSNALCGPLVVGRCLIFLPLGSSVEATVAKESLMETLSSSRADTLQEENLRIGFADPRPLEDLASAWPEAQSRLLGREHTQDSLSAPQGSQAEVETFLLSISDGDPDRVRSAFESLLLSYEVSGAISVSDRYRIISLLGTTLGRLVGRGPLSGIVAHLWTDFEDLPQASSGTEFCLLVRARLATIAAAVRRANHWPAPVAGAMDFISQNYGQTLTLD